MGKPPVDGDTALKLWHAYAKVRQQINRDGVIGNVFAVSMLPDIVGIRMALDNELREVTHWWEQIGWRV